MRPIAIIRFGIACVITVSVAASFAYMDPPAQAVLSLCIMAATIFSWRRKGSETVRITLIVLSTMAAVRYLVWRTAHTLNLDGFGNSFCSLALYGAEAYTIMIMLAFHFQTLNLDRTVDDIPPDPDYLPSVDVFIATYNEPEDVVRRTAVGATRIDYPNKRVYILDDGRRPEMRRLAEEVGCFYIDRPDNTHAKAGNINHALPLTDGEIILFLDADHIPVYTILRRTVHYFKDPLVAVVQTPHRFMNPGPVERNLYLEGRLPGEQELFYQIVQVGRSHWNAAFFCGSAGLIRRSALMEVGGIGTQTVTEDCETNIHLHARGYKSIFFSVPQVAGLSPESYAAYIIQQTRWAQGSVQMLRLMCPWLVKGLSLPQRICYFFGMTHFFFGIPRLIFYVTPLAFLFFDLRPMKISYVAYLIASVPYFVGLFLSTNYTFRNFRHSFWSDIYDAIAAPYVALCTTVALINPRAGRFRVTPKGIEPGKAWFETKLALPHIFFLCLCIVALVVGIDRMVTTRNTILHSSILINVVWNVYNILILTAACFVALERPYIERAHRVKKEIPAELISMQAAGQRWNGSTVDVSESGALVKVKAASGSFKPEQQLIVEITDESGRKIDVRGVVRRLPRSPEGTALVALEFVEQDAHKVGDIIQAAYCQPETWIQFREPFDSLLSSLCNLVYTPVRVTLRTWTGRPKRPRKRPALGVKVQEG